MSGPGEREPVSFVVPGEPASKARARFTNQGSKARTYTPEKTKHAEQAVAWRFRQAARSWLPLAEPEYRVEVRFYPGTRQRRDVDNMLKLILDGLNGVAWADDRQVTDIHGRVIFNDPEPRTEVTVTELEPQGRLTGTCENCGTAFPTWPSHAAKVRFCSPACRGFHSRAQRPTVACATCGTTFRPTRPSKGQRFCSPKCAKPPTRVDLTCPTCGAVFQVQPSQAAKRRFCSNGCRRGGPPGRGPRGGPEGATLHPSLTITPRSP